MSSVIPPKKLEDKQIVKLILIVMTVCGIVFLLSATPLYLNRDYIAEQYRIRDLLSAISNAGGTSLKDISFDIDNDKKTFDCTLVVRDSCTTDTCDAMRKAIDKYLKENKAFYLNEGYIIRLYIQDRDNGPWFLSISNQNYFSPSKKLYNSLACLSIDYNFSPNLGNISNFKNWTDIRALDLSYIHADEIPLLSQFTQLEYISKDGGFTKEETQVIKQILPNCEVG